MNITISNIKTLCEQTFEDVTFDKVDNLLKIKQFFAEDKSSLSTMLREEFTFYWNDIFSKKLLHHNFVLDFPDFIKPSLSVFLLNWKEYMEEKYNHNDFSPNYTMREVQLQDLQDEVDKVKALFKISRVNIFKENFSSIEQGINLHTPSYYIEEDKDEHDTTFKDALISGVFYLAKVQFSSHKTLKEDDLENFFKCYYSSFYKDKTVGRDVIFSNTLPKNADLTKIMHKKLDFLQPKKVEEQTFFYNLNVDSQVFAQALHNIIGIKSYTDESVKEQSIMQLKTFFTGIKVKVLENKMPLRHNIQHKTLKI